MFNKSAIKNKQTSFEYHFSNDVSSKPYFSVEIPIEKIKEIYEKLKEKYGETENIKEYSTYKHNDIVLTVYPDGSSFCSKINITEIKDTKIPENILVTSIDKLKISNDNFPCKYIYHSASDIIDVIFSVNSSVKIVLACVYENNRNMEKLKGIENLGRPSKLSRSKNFWCELYIISENPLTNFTEIIDFL